MRVRALRVVRRLSQVNSRCLPWACALSPRACSACRTDAQQLRVEGDGRVAVLRRVVTRDTFVKLFFSEKWSS